MITFLSIRMFKLLLINTLFRYALALWKPLDQHKYIGSLQEKQEPPLKYLDYASKHTMPRRGFRPGAREEFTQLLSDTSLDSNDVQGIRKVSSKKTVFTSRSIPYLILIDTSITASRISSHLYRTR